MRTIMLPALRLLLALSVLTGLLYPVLVTGIARVAFPRLAQGSLLSRGNQVVGSALLAQNFTTDRYFWPRPSAGDCATVPSVASNLGPTSAALRAAVAARAAHLRAAHHLTAAEPLPPDLLYASGSGLDPQLSPAAVHLQVARVAAARGLAPDRVAKLVAQYIESPQLGLFGEPRINVLRLNLALDALE